MPFAWTLPAGLGTQRSQAGVRAQGGSLGTWTAAVRKMMAFWGSSKMCWANILRTVGGPDSMHEHRRQHEQEDLISVMP